MKYIIEYSSFDPYDDEPLRDSEKIFGKQTRLEKQFSKIMVDGLISSNKDVSYLWNCLNALKIEIKEIIDSNDPLFKELMHKIVEGENPIETFKDICNRLPTKTEEINRIINKLK